MTFAWPHLLWLALIPLALLVWELTHRRRATVASHPKILRAEAGDRSLSFVSGNASLATARVRPWLCFGLVLCVLAAARPQWGRLEEPVFDQAREIIIAIDLSRSMLTPDVKPSRLDRAKLLTQSLLERLDGERVGLVVFSGTAFLQSPLSADYEILREFLPALGPDFLPEGGTNYRALVDTAIDAFASTTAADRFLIVLSDGESTVDDWRERIEDLRTKGVRVIGLGVGTTAGAMIPDGSGGLVKDERGAVVMSKLEPATLQELASSTNGVYQDASNWIDLAALVQATIETGRKGEFTEKNTVRLVERFQWPLALGVWLLLVSFYYEFPVRPKPRDLKIGRDLRIGRKAPAPPAPPPEITVAVLCALFSVFGAPALPSTRAADTPETPTPPPLAKIVGRISEAPQPSARDWAELGRETVTWGSRLQSSQEAVPEGPVRDALAAVELGSKLDPKTADWPKLREELEALLQKPEDQQQKQENEDQQKQQDQQKQDQQKQDQSKQGDPQQQKDQQQQSSEKSDPSNQKQQNDPPQSDQQKSPSEQESAFGDMKDQQPPPPPPPQETQKVGGVPEKKEGEAAPPDPALALPLQKLDQLKNQDSPAELFKLMEGEKDQTPRTKSKDW